MTRTVFALALLAGAIAARVAAESSVSATPPPTSIVFAADRLPALYGEIYRLDANGTVVDLSRSAFTDEQPVVSPNGKQLAFVSVRDEKAGVYVIGIDGTGLRRLDAPPRRIGGSAELVRLTWAPDSRTLAALSGDLRTRLTILRPGRAPIVATQAAFVYGPTWSPDGRLLAVEAGGDPQDRREVRVFTRAGKLAWRAPFDEDFPGWSRSGLLATVAHSVVRVFGEDGKRRLAFRGRTAAWSPDGRRLASVARGVVEVRTADGRVFLRKPLTGLAGKRVVLRWIDSRRLLVAFVGTTRLRGLDTATGKLFRGSHRYFADPLSPDGRFVAGAARAGAHFAVEVSRLPNGAPRVYGHVPGCYDDGVFTAALTGLQFVPRRASLVYESWCTEPFAALYTVNPDGSGLARLTNRQEQEQSPARSPDGTRIAYTRYDRTGTSCKGCPGSLAVAAADGSGPRVLTTPSGDAVADAGPSWSPDGTQILFSRWSVSKAGELFVVPAAGGDPRDLHVQSFLAAWGPTRIAYVDPSRDPISLWTALPDGSDRRKLADVPAEILPDGLAWSADGRLAYAAPRTGGVLVFSGAAEQHVQLPFRDLRSLAWSPDGTRFVVVGLAAHAATYDLYSVRTDGTDVRRLTTDLDAFSASWR